MSSVGFIGEKGLTIGYLKPAIDGSGLTYECISKGLQSKLSSTTERKVAHVNLQKLVSWLVRECSISRA